MPLAPLPAELADPRFAIGLDALTAARVGDADFVLRHRGDVFRAYALHDIDDRRFVVILSFDRLFAQRTAAALRLWRATTGRAPGRDPATIPAARRDRLILALRALDGRLEEASYREIAEALFGVDRIPERGWKTHDLRDRTVRLVRYGLTTMQGGYRQLLFYPYRRRV